MTHQIEMPNIRPDRRSPIRVVPVADLRKLHRLLALILVAQVANLGIAVWRALL
jgi:hypothetical protein